MAYQYSSRGGQTVLWIVIHTAEGSTNRSALGNYFWSEPNASSHVGIDGGGIQQYVQYVYAAWTLRNGNEESENAELCGFARWSRAQWLSTGTVDGVVNPRQMVRNAALWAKARCAVRGIPVRHLTPTQVGQRQQGIIGHVDYTNGTGDGTHTDPGPNFPWDVFFADMETSMAITDDDLIKIAQKVWGYKNTDTGETSDCYALQRYGARPWEQPVEDGSWGPMDAQHALAYIHQIETRNANMAASMATLTSKVDSLATKVDTLLAGS